MAVIKIPDGNGDYISIRAPRGLQGETGPQGIQGPQGNQGLPGQDGLITEIIAGDNIEVDDTNPSKPIISSTGGVPAVVDNLTSTSTDYALSANQGKVLKDSFDGLEDLFQIVNYTFASGVQSAGAKGNISFSMTIPDGYTSIGAHVSSNQIANLGGAQFTPAYNHIGTTGTQTIYVWYYFPTAVKPSRYVDFKLICIKTAYYNEV